MSALSIGPAPTVTSASLAPTAAKPSTSVSVPITLVSRPGVSRNRLVTLQAGTPKTRGRVASQSLLQDSSPDQETIIGSLDDILGHLAAEVIVAGKRKK